MLKRCFAPLSLYLALASMPSLAADMPIGSTLSPWEAQGEVALPLDATLAQTQIAALSDERDRLLWVRDRGGFPQVQPAPDEPVFDLGIVSRTVETLRTRLILSNDLPESYATPAGSLAGQTFDFEMLQAVQRFQTRHGLGSDGVVDGGTLKALNISVERSLEDLEISLQTWQALATEIGDDEPFVLVNTIEGVIRLYVRDERQMQLTATLDGTTDADEHAGSTSSKMTANRRAVAPQWELNEGSQQVEHPEALVHAILYTANDWDLSTIETAVNSAISRSMPLPNPMNIHVVALPAWADQGVVRYVDAELTKTPQKIARPLPPTLIADADSVATKEPSQPR